MNGSVSFSILKYMKVGELICVRDIYLILQKLAIM
jgi:hypothetical protein